MQTGTAEGTGVLGRELKAPQSPQKIQEFRDWPQASRSAECAEGPHVEGWELGGGQSEGYW